MKVPGAPQRTSLMTERNLSEDLLKPPAVTLLPFDIVELDEAGTSQATIFTVDDNEYLLVKKVSYFCQAAGSLSISATPDGDSFANANLLHSSTLAANDEGFIELFEGQAYGPGEKMIAACGTSGCKINLKVTVERVTGALVS